MTRYTKTWLHHLGRPTKHFGSIPHTDGLELGGGRRPIQTPIPAPTATDPDRITARQAAKLLGVRGQDLTELRLSGRLHPKLSGGQYVYSAAELERVSRTAIS